MLESTITHVPNFNSKAHNNEPRITSIEIAELTGKKHNHLMRDIRNMEPAWEKVHGSKFGLMLREVHIGNGAVRREPCYNLTKIETLYIATKFNDEARARLVLRWRELEQEHLKHCGIRKLLVTDDDVMHEAETIIGRTLVSFNQNADGCITASDIADAIGIDVKDLNSWLTDKGIQSWKRGQYRLTPEYEGRGLAQDRLFIYYSKKGKKKERTYLVWTQKGAEMIHNLL